MAEPPPFESLKGEEEAPMERGQAAEASESDLHSLTEIGEMKRSFLRQVEEEFPIDVEAEYRKEMEEDRIADQKNGHLVDELDSAVLRAPPYELGNPFEGVVGGADTRGGSRPRSSC